MKENIFLMYDVCTRFYLTRGFMALLVRASERFVEHLRFETQLSNLFSFATLIAMLILERRLYIK